MAAKAAGSVVEGDSALGFSENSGGGMGDPWSAEIFLGAGVSKFAPGEG